MAPEDIIPLCFTCNRFKGVASKIGFVCDAYPKGIPVEIIASAVDHHYPQEGDQNLQYIPIPKNLGEYILNSMATTEDETKESFKEENHPRVSSGPEAGQFGNGGSGGENALQELSKKGFKNPKQLRPRRRDTIPNAFKDVVTLKNKQGQTAYLDMKTGNYAIGGGAFLNYKVIENQDYEKFHKALVDNYYYLTTKEELSNIHWYKRTGYRPINKYLRGVSEGDENVKKATKIMEDYINKQSIPSDITVYRFVAGEFAEKLHKTLTKTPNISWVEKSFVSTTIDPSKLDSIREILEKEVDENLYSKDKIVTMEIKVPKGAKCAAFADGTIKEAEMCLNKGITLSVRSYDPKTKHIVVAMEAE